MEVSITVLYCKKFSWKEIFGINFRGDAKTCVWGCLTTLKEHHIILLINETCGLCFTRISNEKQRGRTQLYKNFFNLAKFALSNITKGVWKVQWNNDRNHFLVEKKDCRGPKVKNMTEVYLLRKKHGGKDKFFGALEKFFFGALEKFKLWHFENHSELSGPS